MDIPLWCTTELFIVEGGGFAETHDQDGVVERWGGSKVLKKTNFTRRTQNIPRGLGFNSTINMNDQASSKLNKTLNKSYLELGDHRRSIWIDVDQFN